MTLTLLVEGKTNIKTILNEKVEEYALYSIRNVG